LSNLCWIYDSNRITIEGHTDLAFSDDVATRFIGYGWNVTRVGDARAKTKSVRRKRNYDWPEDAKSSCRRVCANIVKPDWASADGRCATRG
jgi:hypothetical protein